MIITLDKIIEIAMILTVICAMLLGILNTLEINTLKSNPDLVFIVDENCDIAPILNAIPADRGGTIHFTHQRE
jgi:hypothetical protein